MSLQITIKRPKISFEVIKMVSYARASIIFLTNTSQQQVAGSRLEPGGEAAVRVQAGQGRHPQAVQGNHGGLRVSECCTDGIRRGDLSPVSKRNRHRWSNKRAPGQTRNRLVKQPLSLLFSSISFKKHDYVLL